MKNIGRGLIRSVSAQRKENGPFKSLQDFLERMEEGELNKRAVENLIRCGAMDCFGNHRSELIGVYEALMDSIASSRKKNLEGQMGLFAMLEEDTPAARIEIPRKQEFTKAELMAMEKETTGIYLTGHPMDDYRKYLKNTHVKPIGELMEEGSPYHDDDVVSVAGIVQVMKTKTTKNNSMMAYVTVEDDTASMEMLAFSNVLNQYGSILREGSALVITGRLSMRDDKDPQIVINRIRPMSDFSQAREPEGAGKPPAMETGQGKTLYLRLPGESDRRYPKVKAILNMFPGNNPVVLFFADTKARRGTRCVYWDSMLGELERVLGKENVVLK